jgi:hypothetical protein
MRRFLSTCLAVCAAALFPALGLAQEKPKAILPGKDIDLVVCLDVSNSMDGLIASAKIKLWDVVNELAKAKPTPNLRVALYSYGHSQYDYKSGWVRKELDLTVDLDEVYAKLNGLKTGGGTELVARVCKAAIEQQTWTDSPNALKLIFVCGNEPADQDKQVALGSVAEHAKKAHVLINTIYCGSASNTESAGWRNFALACNGSYANIDQQRAKNDLALHIKTPYDDKINKLGVDLNKTYVAYGKLGAEKALNQVEQDRAAAGAAPGAALARGEAKANALYKNSAWDLVDRLKDDPKFDVNKIPEADLPEDMKKMKPEERTELLKKKLAERTALQKEINELAAKRAKVIEEERKKLPKNEGEVALDEALKSIIRAQAKAKGFDFPEPAKK